MKASKTFLIIPVAILSLASCSSESSHEDKSPVEDSTIVAQDTTPVTVDDYQKFKFDFALANIPSPAASIEELSKWKVDYDNNILNNSQNQKNYNSEFSKAFNLGVYNIDMCYAIVNEKGQDVLKYMKTVLLSTDELGLKGAVDQMMGKRAENNLSSKDSLLHILDEILIKSDSYLRTNERLYTATVIFAGSWVESLYLTCKITDAATDHEIKKKGHRHLWEQRFHLGNLINVLEDYKDKKEASGLLTELKAVHDEIQKVKIDTDIDDAKFASISSKIYSIRDKYTK